MDEERTILVTTHQVEEIEHLLTDVLFIEQGKIILDTSVEDIGSRFVQLVVKPEQAGRRRGRSSPSTSATCWDARCCSSITRRANSSRRWARWARRLSRTCSWR